MGLWGVALSLWAGMKAVDGASVPSASTAAHDSMGEASAGVRWGSLDMLMNPHK